MHRSIAVAGVAHGSAMLGAAGCLALGVGVLVYLSDRDASRALLIPAVAALAGGHLFGALGQWLPSFVHPFAFGLFSAAVLPPRAGPRYGACVVWCAVNVAFELGQHPWVREPLAEALQSAAWTPLARPLANYFLRGTFDVGDIAAAVLGGSAAAVLLRLMHGAGLETPHAT